MNVQEFIDSGVLYDYCTGVLLPGRMAEVERACAEYPEIQEELIGLKEALGQDGSAFGVEPAPALQETIWNTLDNVNREKSCDLTRLPVVNKYSDHNNWKRMVVHFMPASFDTDQEMKVIRDSGGVTQLLVLTRTDVAEEVHEDERESFIILEGECECHIGTDTYRLGPGDFIEIPMHAKHNVRVTSPYVVAVLQHVAV